MGLPALPTTTRDAMQGAEVTRSYSNYTDQIILSPSPGSSRWPERERFGEERDDLNDLIMMLSRIFITYSMGRVND